MPAYIYTGEDARTYPTLGIEAVPGLVVEFDARPPTDGEPAAPAPEGARYAPADGRWEPTKKKPTPPAADAAAAAPAQPGQKED